MEIKHFPIEINENALNEGALKVVSSLRDDWNEDNVKYKLYQDGHTNKLVACIKEEEVILVRVYGKDSNLLINRHQEKQTMTLLSIIGCARPVYCSFDNGIAYEFAKGITLDDETIFDINIQRLVAKELVKMHSFNLNEAVEKLGGENLFEKKSCLFSKMIEWLSHIRPDAAMPAGWSKEQIREEVDELEEHLTSLGSPTVFCHNDLLPKNIIYDEENDKIAFIDFEYAFPNYQAFDIGNYFCEYAGMEGMNYDLYPSEAFQKQWLTEYLRAFRGGSGEMLVSAVDLERLYVQVNKFALASHVLWAIWGIVQSHHSTIDYDYLQFASLRLQEYKRRKHEFFTLKLPSP